MKYSEIDPLDKICTSCWGKVRSCVCSEEAKEMAAAKVRLEIGELDRHHSGTMAACLGLLGFAALVVAILLCGVRP